MFPRAVFLNRFPDICRRLGELEAVSGDVPAIPPDKVPVDWLQAIELRVILAERRRRRDQPYILRELEPPEPPDNKTEETARLFASRRYGLPYYVGFDLLNSVG